MLPHALLRGVKKFSQLILVLIPQETINNIFHPHASVMGIQHHACLAVNRVVDDDIAFAICHIVISYISILPSPSALPMPRTVHLHTRAFYVIMWTGQIRYWFVSIIILILFHICLDFL